MQRVLFVDRMRPDDAPAVAEAWAAHDRTGLPEEIGLASRTLFRFHGLYAHLVEGRPELEGDLLEHIFAARAHPAFAEIRDRLGSHLTPYSPAFRTLKDTRAEEFYNWRADITGATR
ncbi:TcmI family type II polyketide cyclase [Streptomyces sp. NPDC126522]|uniref:TcmI family type II polyketide cyclase n=1 Tax=Streptomyces sp. NPDC126522 TaxID=3155211 RepID=UPI0033215D18